MRAVTLKMRLWRTPPEYFGQISHFQDCNSRFSRMSGNNVHVCGETPMLGYILIKLLQQHFLQFPPKLFITEEPTMFFFKTHFLQLRAFLSPTTAYVRRMVGLVAWPSCLLAARPKIGRMTPWPTLLQRALSVSADRLGCRAQHQTLSHHPRAGCLRIKVCAER